MDTLLFICTPEKPWQPSYGAPVRHTNTREVGDQEDGYPGGDIVTMECKDCGHRWRRELAQ